MTTLGMSLFRTDVEDRQRRIVAWLDEQEAPASAKTIAAALGFSARTARRLLVKLDEEGRVIAVRDGRGSLWVSA